MLLAAAGITGGRRVTTHHVAIDDLRATGADVVEARFVDDGDVVTAGGVTSGIDLALHLVARFADAGIAERVAREIEYERVMTAP
jgi:transcriptional regulator GlxA family with amidase domain